MEFGLFFTLQSPTLRPSDEMYKRAFETIEYAEELGFSRVWLAEHHFSNYSYSSQPFLFLSYLAAKLKKIRLGTAIVPVPLHHPLFIAEKANMLDLLSNGRFDLGLGRGYQVYQFDRLGISKDDDLERMKEGVDLIKLALNESTFEFSGKYYDIPETTIIPPIQNTTMPLWFVVNTKIRESVEFALSRGMNIFTGVGEPLNKLTSLRESYPELNFPEDLKIGTSRHVFVSDDRSEIDKAIEEMKWHIRVTISQRYKFGGVENGKAIAKPFIAEPSSEEILENYVIFGNPDEVIRKINHLTNGIGLNTFNASFWIGSMSHETVLKSIGMFREFVMPAFEMSTPIPTHEPEL